MAKATYWQRGESLDYVNSGDTVIEANTIVALGTRIGVIGTDINPKERGSIHVTGVFAIAKASGAIEMGANVYFNGTAITTAASGATPAGYAAAAAGADDATVLVKLLG